MKALNYYGGRESLQQGEKSDKDEIECEQTHPWKFWAVRSSLITFAVPLSVSAVWSFPTPGQPLAGSFPASMDLTAPPQPQHGFGGSFLSLAHSSPFLMLYLAEFGHPLQNKIQSSEHLENI